MNSVLTCNLPHEHEQSYVFHEKFLGEFKLQKLSAINYLNSLIHGDQKLFFNWSDIVKSLLLILQASY